MKWGQVHNVCAFPFFIFVIVILGFDGHIEVNDEERNRGKREDEKWNRCCHRICCSIFFRKLKICIERRIGSF
ncbi:MAG: hypothetical protein U9N77_03325, partial [Thermodesulfobacteriota bacterium]|nr:hypothetical protein [Thermodesulfobacteriota bacterium]